MGNNTGKICESISLMEPMMPEEGVRDLDDLILELIAKANRLAGLIHPMVQRSVGDLVRSMNCYYSNLIEGHDTHPRDIERALKMDYSKQPKKRDLQMEAKAHIEVQKMIDESAIRPDIVTTNYICWLHREFCKRLPQDMLWVKNLDTNKKIEVLPGELRQDMVSVGRHIPPRPENLNSFLKRFEEAYRPDRLTHLRKIVAVAASHHRLLWIHPFLEGNGRVGRLFSHSFLKYVGLGSSLWSVSRGLARRVDVYRSKLEAADNPRSSDLDGRGSLSAKGLLEFCRYFLMTCIDQIDFMGSLLEPSELLRRMQIYCEEEERAGRLPRRSFSLLREAWLVGQFERGRASEITNYEQRQARTVLNGLTKLGFLISDTPKGPVRLGFPVDVVERWFPKLYPAVS